MKIKRLHLVSFGKFQNKTIELSDGLNLVFGANEAGKSTIQHFIEGVFFGFYKPYRKKRVLSEDYHRFKPRHSSSYFGSIIIEDNNKREIMIERDFLKQKDGVRIYDAVTGEDISKEFPFDQVTKQVLPLGNDGITAQIYNNTVNVKQMSSVSDEAVLQEVNDRLLEMASNGDDSISISRVLKYLEEKRKVVGSVGKSKSNYGVAVKEITRLKILLRESHDIYNQVKDNIIAIKEYQLKVDSLENACTEMSDKFIEQNQAEVEAAKVRLNKIREEGETLENQLENLGSCQTVDDQELGEIQELQAQLEEVETCIRLFQDTLFEREQKYKNIESRRQRLEKSFRGFTRDIVEADYKAYYIGVERKNKQGNLNKVMDHSEDIPDKTKQASVLPLALTTVLGWILLILSVVNPQNILSVAIQVVFGLIGVGFGVAGIIFLYKLNPKKSMQSVKNESVFERSATINDGEPSDITEAILRKYNKKNGESFEKFVLQTRNEFTRHEGMKIEEKSLQAEIEKNEKELKQYVDKKNSLMQKIEVILQENGIESLEELANNKGVSQEARDLQVRIDANKRLVSELSQEKDGAGYTNDSINRAYGKNNREYARLLEAWDAYKHEISRIQGENNTLIDGAYGTPVEIEEQIEAYQKSINEYEEDLKACDMAETFFKNYANKIHSDQAPNLNKKIGEIIFQITKKYDEVKVDKDLKVSIIDPNTKERLSLGQLSGGTMDQLSLALRLGVDFMLETERNMPLILDDPFVQYDDTRKAESVGYLSRLTKEKQVILLTCTGDEKRILDDNNYHYEGIAI